MRKFLSGGLAFLFIFLSLSFVASAGSPQFVFYKSSEQDAIPDVLAGEDSEIYFFVGNLDETRDVTVQLSSKSLATNFEETAMPLEWASFSPDYSFELEPGEEEEVSLDLDIPKNVKPGVYKISLRGTLTNYSGAVSSGGVVMSSAVGIILRVNVLNPDYVPGMGNEVIEDDSGMGVGSFLMLGLFFVSFVALVAVVVLMFRKNKEE